MSPSSLARILYRGLHGSARRSALTKMSMPAMSPTMTEGGISSWKKAEGESFSSGDVLLEIETDKATIDVEAQEDGILAKIVAQDGSKGVAVGSTIAVLAEEGDDLSGAAELAASASEEAPSAPKEEKAPEPPASPAPSNEASPSTTSAKPELAKGDRIFASPIAKKIALERGIPLSKVKGSGPEGRIIREDVEKYKPELSSSTAGPSTPGEPSADYTDIPLSNMLQSQSPHFYLTVDIQMDKVMKLREVFNKSLAEKGAKLSINDFVVKAVAKALEDVPEVNTAWLGDVIRQYKKADISIAVATPTGLITPIIKDAGSKGLATISAEAKALAKKARDGKLSPHEYQGGTFTISNLGMYDVSHFTAIINPPQSCILAVGSTQPTLVPSAEDERGFKTANIMKVTISGDHRSVDGALGARWLSAFKAYLENPLTFML
ncbi:dihydrolipoamide acetyltransferase [Lactarius akahatsu]|uniref:Acetyltransferase component of pyruvate dehydrogenase complex n=1 Tax=Lactarius akahatsu TaxID=416441 RepID=A0AAD4LFD3_9AGAM|nr:dihydrolipoamide acetyltransferase [Lactarius akahatsu]